MRHLGDITKINGAEAPIVNVVIGGSPCQDLSVAGKRAGLAGERSGLFMEQLRVIKEMRKADADRGKTGKDIRPRFMVWENVPGAFSSNKGADFGAVLQETVRVVCEAPAVPMPNKGWPLAGCLYGEDGGWSLAWRVFDAQFWGVPQRRRRIALVADFGGLTAPEILFEREGVSGYYPQGRTPWETATRSAETGIGGSVSGSLPRTEMKGIPLLNDQGGQSVSGNDNATVAPTLRAEMHGNIPAVCDPVAFDTYNMAVSGDRTVTLRAGAEYNYAPVFQPKQMSVYDARGNGEGGVAPTMTGDHNGHISDYTAICVAQRSYSEFSKTEIATTLKSSGGNCGGGGAKL